MKKKIGIIGSTGVLGTKLIKFLNKTDHEITLITCYSNDAKLLKQKNITNSKSSIVLSDGLINKYKNLNYGSHHLSKFIINNKIDIFYILDTGYKTLEYLDLITKFQKNCLIAIANKEALIAGGSLLIKNIANSDNNFLPLDSEHFSLFDHLQLDNKCISKIFLTASGGPFYFNKNLNLKNIKLKDAIKHPVWKMGYKNSIDSSNMINKILEIFELSSILNISPSKIDIAISPEAFIHSIVYFMDQRINLNCFVNDMMIPMSHPFFSDPFIKKVNTDLELINNNNLKLFKFDNQKFQIFPHYKSILKYSHPKQIIFMMLNSEVVDRFVNNKVKYNQIIPFIMDNINKFHLPKKFDNLNSIIKFMNKNTLKIRSL